MMWLSFTQRRNLEVSGTVGRELYVLGIFQTIVIRFTNHLLAGQSATLEGSGEVGARSSGLVLSRIGDALHVMPLSGMDVTQTLATDYAVIPATLPVTAAVPAQR